LKPATDSSPDCTVIVPVYRNAEHIEALIERLELINQSIAGGIGAVLVVDGSPDDCHEQLLSLLPAATFRSQLICLSRNFGSFAAIRAGLEAADGECFAVMAADLQEPAELIIEMLETISADRADIVVGTRASRQDPWLDRLFASLFWRINRRMIEPGMPVGGVDVFGCNRAFREHLLKFTEANSSLIGQLFWLGFRRHEIAYHRVPRLSGKSGWSLAAKRKYFLDSLYAFTDLPIRAFLGLGLLGLMTSIVLALAVVVARLGGLIEVPGYAATVITIVFFAGLNLVGLGVIGSYVWRVYENTKQRPLAVVMKHHSFKGKST
jgi:polyisoprenyl-phosphate glycosyltransferase